MTEQIPNFILKQGIIFSPIFLFWIVWLIGRAREESYARDDEGGYNLYV